MTAKIDPKIINACRRGERPGVLILVDKPVESGGVAPLELERGLKTLGEVTREVHSAISPMMSVLHRRTDSGHGMTPLAAVIPPEETVPRAFPNLGAISGAILSAASLQCIADTPGVRRVIPMPRFAPLVEPTNYRVAAPAMLGNGPTPGLMQANVPALWDADVTGVGASIGHIDTGVNAHHRAFAHLSGMAYVEFDANANVVAGAKARDSHDRRHGTHVAGTLVGGQMDGTRFGVAPGASLYSAAIFPHPTPLPADMDSIVIGALNWVIGQRPLVVNLSFGDNKRNNTFLDIVSELVNANILVVCAAGNGGIGALSSPGDYLNVISVGAVNKEDDVCTFSGSALRRNKVRPDLCAPGESVLSAGRGEDDVALSDGTSMAAPHVAGVLAALRARAPELSPRTWKHRLRKFARVPGGWDSSRGGAGVLDARELLVNL